MRNLFILFLVFGVISVAEGKKTKPINLDKMSEKKRTEYLLARTKELTMKHGPDFYREYKAPVIKRLIVNKENYKLPPKLQTQYPDRVYYEVGYPYDHNKEIFFGDYSIEVRFWADTGEAFLFIAGTGMGFFLDKLTEEEASKYFFKFDKERHTRKQPRQE